MDLLIRRLRKSTCGADHFNDGCDEVSCHTEPFLSQLRLLQLALGVAHMNKTLSLMLLVASVVFLLRRANISVILQEWFYLLLSKQVAHGIP